MQAEIISIGDELTTGQRLDTNSQWLSQQLCDLGIRVLRHTTVRDDLAENVTAFREAAERADVVISTGGLGPTADDLTRDALAEVSGEELVLHEEIVEHIRGLFASFGRDVPEQNIVQARFPRGATIIPNPNGTAPGMEISLARAGRKTAVIIALPGVPAELRSMWHESVAPRLRNLSGAPAVIRHRQIRCFGQGESHIEAMLPDLIRRGRQPRVGITASDSIITLRITAEGATDEECQAAIAPTVETIRQCLGDLIFGEGDDELEHAVLRLLEDRKETVAAVEWASAGLVSQRLRAADRTSSHFRGGWVLGGRDAGLPDPQLEAVKINAASDGDNLLLEKLAQSAQRLFDADWGLAVGPLPDASTAGNRPRVFFALANRSSAEVAVRSAPCFGHPQMLLSRTAKQALNFLRLTLLKT